LLIIFPGVRDADFEALLVLPNVNLVEVDLSLKESWEKVGEGYDYVYHLAAVNGTRRFYVMPYDILKNDTVMNINALEWLRAKNPKGKIMFTSSCEIYGGAREAFNALKIPTPENVPLVIPDVSNPRWSYAGVKMIGEQLFIHAAKEHDFRMSIVRPHNFFGPREGHEHVIPEFIIRSLKRRTRSRSMVNRKNDLIAISTMRWRRCSLSWNPRRRMEKFITLARMKSEK